MDVLHPRIGDLTGRTKEVRNIIQRVGTAGLAFALAGCGRAGHRDSPRGRTAGFDYPGRAALGTDRGAG